MRMIGDIKVGLFAYILKKNWKLSLYQAVLDFPSGFPEAKDL